MILVILLHKGLDFLGYGYDARLGFSFTDSKTTDMIIMSKLFDCQFSDGLTVKKKLISLFFLLNEKDYIYPLFNETYRVPNELYAITIAST